MLPKALTLCVLVPTLWAGMFGYTQKPLIYDERRVEEGHVWVTLESVAWYWRAASFSE